MIKHFIIARKVQRNDELQRIRLFTSNDSNNSCKYKNKNSWYHRDFRL